MSLSLVLRVSLPVSPPPKSLDLGTSTVSRCPCTSAAGLVPPLSWDFCSAPTQAGQAAGASCSCLEMSSSALSQLIPSLKALGLARTSQLGSDGAEQQQPLGALGTRPGCLWCSQFLAASPAPIPVCALGVVAEVLGCLGSRSRPAGAAWEGEPSLPTPGGAAAPGPSCHPGQLLSPPTLSPGSASCQDQALNQV